MTIVSTLNGRVHETTALTATLTPDAFPGLVNLAAMLLDRGYPLRARGEILDYVAREGTLEGCGQLHPMHAASAEATYVNGMAEVPASDPAWGSAPGAEWFGRPADDAWTPNDAIQLDVEELLHTDEEFEAWLAAVDDTALPPTFDAVA
jgi:hypothetical protein